jgi:hypothetical protein
MTTHMVVYAVAGLYVAHRLCNWPNGSITAIRTPGWSRRFLVAAVVVWIVGAYMVKLGWVQ